MNCLEQLGPNSLAMLDVRSALKEILGAGALIAQNYQLIKELGETPQGMKFIADDLEHKRQVSLLVLSTQFLSDTMRFTALHQAIDQLRNAPHPMLRKIYALETVAECGVRRGVCCWAVLGRFAPDSHVFSRLRRSYGC